MDISVVKFKHINHHICCNCQDAIINMRHKKELSKVEYRFRVKLNSRKEKLIN